MLFYRCYASKLKTLVDRDLARFDDPIWKLMADRLAQSIPSDVSFGPFVERQAPGVDRPNDADLAERSASLMQELHLAHDLVPIVLPLLVGACLGRHYDQLVENAERARTVLCIVAVIVSLFSLALVVVGPRLAS